MSDDAELGAVEHGDLPVEPRGSATREEELPDDGARVEAATELLAELRHGYAAAEDAQPDGEGASAGQGEPDAEPN